MSEVRWIVGGEAPPYGIDEDLVDEIDNLRDLFQELEWYKLSTLLLKVSHALKMTLKSYREVESWTDSQRITK